MAIVLTPETQRLIEERMKRDGYATADDVVRIALQTLDQADGDTLESLDPDTLAAIERAEAQSARGEGRPWEEVRKELQAKYLDGR
jgi:Arc/MetJ-type ribon-helix-helix transcriptional regulator